MSADGRTFQVCNDHVVDGAARIFEVCRPLGPTDPVFLLGALLALMPLAPDVQRLQVGSLISVERRLKATEATQEALHQRLEAIVVQQDVRQEQHQHFHMPEPSASQVDLGVSADELRRKQWEFLEGESNDGD